MKKILILAGGRGSEREVSIASGKRVAEALCRLGVMAALVDPSQEFADGGEPFSCDLNELKRKSPLFYAVQSESKGSAYLTESVLKLCKRADAVFICLHGGIGENGRLQAVLETFGIKYFGSSPEASALAMDKLTSKRIFESVGIPTPLYTVYRKGERSSPVPPRYPCVVKPIGEGSSVGVSAVRTPIELMGAIESAFKCTDTVIMEAMIRGREVTVGVLNGTPLAVTEIIPKGGFYDYESKYTVGKTVEITPAEISESLTRRAMRLALRTHKALGLENFSRVDMIIEKGTELIYVLEANTIPGMTATSLLPLAAEYRGIDLSGLCERMMR